MFGSDPRQILPVVHHGNQAQIIKACINASPLWSQVKKINLTRMKLNGPLIIQKLRAEVIEMEIASGVNRGKHVLLPRIPIAPSDTELPFTLKGISFQ